MKAEREQGHGWSRRILTGAVLVAWIGVPYLVLQRLEWRPVTVLDWDPVTRAVPFSVGAAWVYFSLYPFLGWAGLGCRKGDFTAFVLACALAALVGHLVFLLWPTEVPRPDVADPGLAYDWLRQVDRPRNALPSMHVALSVLGALALWRRHPGWLGSAAIVWAGAIVWSTLALRQHVAADVVAGGALAAVSWWLVGRARRRPPDRGQF